MAETSTACRLALLVLAAAVLCAGCVGPTYGEGAGKLPAAAITPRQAWTAYGVLEHPELAIDDKANTAAVSGDSYAQATLTIDLGKPCFFNMVVVDHGFRKDGFCRQMALLTSMDGRQFQRLQAVYGTRRLTIVALVTPRMARYIRLEALEPGTEPWAVAEVYVQ